MTEEYCIVNRKQKINVRGCGMGRVNNKVVGVVGDWVQ
jgi:hypothetical protein